MTKNQENWKLDFGVFLVLLLFAWGAAIGLGGLLAHVLPTYDDEVEVVSRDISVGTEGDEYFSLTVRLSSGETESLSVPEAAYEDTPRLGLSLVTLSRSALLGRPTAIFFRSKTMRENGWIKPGSILDTAIDPTELPETEAISLLLAWPIYAFLWIGGWGVIAALLFYSPKPQRGKKAMAPPALRRGWIVGGLAAVSVLVLLWL